MKIFFKYILSILVAFILANFIYLFILSRIDWEFSKTKEAHSFKNKKLKILVFGNSTAMDGINPEMLSNHYGNTYNFSVGGASLYTNYIQLREYLKQNELPEKVLLFMSSGHVNYNNANTVNPIVNYYYENHSKTNSIYYLDNIPLFMFRWLFVENIKKLLSSNHRSAKVIDGQLIVKSIVPDYTLAKPNSENCAENNYYSSGYEYMWRIKKLCIENNIVLEIFEMPCWKEVQNNCSEIRLNKIEGNFSYNLNIHNLNNYRICDTLLDSNKDWLSKNHLNYFGSLKVTAKVLDILSTSPSNN